MKERKGGEVARIREELCGGGSTQNALHEKKISIEKRISSAGEDV